MKAAAMISHYAPVPGPDLQHRTYCLHPVVRLRSEPATGSNNGQKPFQSGHGGIRAGNGPPRQSGYNPGHPADPGVRPGLDVFQLVGMQQFRNTGAGM
jgi:hypothetical protein